ncbi:hypothetical protein [Flavobacterium anhuiense]|uniref:hypothetical protein n=1 Tax=Flavobacterium anhuiense TaxID=459526 RepID=UPI0034D95C76
MKSIVRLLSLVAMCLISTVFYGQIVKSNFELTLIAPEFPQGVSNQAVNIQFPNVPIWGWIEVTITSGYNNQLSTGMITKRYEIGHNTANRGGYFIQKTEIPVAFGNVAAQWHIGEFNKDTNSIPIYHLVNTSNVLTIKVEGLLANSSDIDSIKSGTTISALQTIAAPGTRHYMSIMQDRVGIGTNSPDTALTVNGTTHSKEVKVDTNIWPDFVFKKDYNLPKIAEVERHIKEKGHLENIPSEEEVLKNGINLGEMNAKLLQKIEELTLYVIDLNKKVNDLEIKNDKLEKQNSLLSNEIMNLKGR